MPPRAKVRFLQRGAQQLVDLAVLLTARGDVVGAVEVHRLDRVQVHEVAYVDGLRAARRDLVQFLGLHHHVLALVNLEALDDAFYRVQCWDDGDSWKIDARTAHPRARWHDQLLQRLCHPRWALPVRIAHRFCHCPEPDAPYQWNHTCAFYFEGHAAGHDDLLYLRVHASPEGHDYHRQIATLRQVGAPGDWVARAFPQKALQHHDQHSRAARLR